MEGRTVFTPLQKALKSRVVPPAVTLYDLAYAVGNLANTAKSHFTEKAEDLTPALAQIVESVCVIANTGGVDVLDVKAAMHFYGSDAKSMALKRTVRELTGHVYNMFNDPQSTGSSLIQITTNIMTVCTAYDIKLKTVIDYAIAKNKKK